MLLTYKYRIKDNHARKQLRKHAIAVNQVWNWCNAYQKHLESKYKAGAPKQKWLSHFDMQKQCKGVGKELGIHQQSVGEICHQYASSRNKNKHSLRYRSSTGSQRALGWIPFSSQSYQIDNNSITYLGKTYRWFGNKKRPLPDTAKSGAFIEDASGKWFVVFVVDVPDLPTGVGEIGIDLGLKTLATCSNGTKIDSIQVFRKWEDKLAIAQRAGNRKRVVAIHKKIKNIRQDYLHKVSAQLARDNALICVGDVSSSKLAKTDMAKSVYDAGWGLLKNMLFYKASRHRAIFEVIDERYTTVTCSDCFAISGPRGLEGLRIREWACDECGVCHDRDINSAKNILARSVARP